MKKWAGWIMLVIVLFGDITLLAALIYTFTHSWQLGIIISLFVYNVWRKTGGFSNWKIKNMKQFSKNWKGV